MVCLLAQNAVNRIMRYNRYGKYRKYSANNRLTGDVLTKRGREAISANFGRILAQATQCDHSGQEQQNRLNWHIVSDFLDDKLYERSRRLNVGYVRIFSASLITGSIIGSPIGI